MIKLYKFDWGQRRGGRVSGVFVADDAEIAAIMGKTIYFGEILGKHSEVYGTLDPTDLTVKSDDQNFIAKLVEIFESSTIAGYNPLHYIEMKDDEDE